MATIAAQYTNFNIESASTVQKLIHRKDTGEEIQLDYKVITLAMLKQPIFKMGYCCEMRGTNYPIFLTINGKEKEFRIGNSGMYEFQPEVYMNINKSKEEKIAEPLVTKILVPAGINFVLDYYYSA